MRVLPDEYLQAFDSSLIRACRSLAPSMPAGQAQKCQIGEDEAPIGGDKRYRIVTRRHCGGVQPQVLLGEVPSRIGFHTLESDPVVAEREADHQ